MRRLIPIALVGLSLLVGAMACGPTNTNDQIDKQRKQSVRDRSSTFARAERAAPIPKTQNFPLRKALVEFTARQDLEHHPWYVYILGMNGNVIGYYVAKTVPINACDFLSSTEVVDASDTGKVVLTAPSLDGVFYGGGGASAGCDAWFFFDQATNALIQIRGVAFYTADQPLRLDAQPIKVAG